MSLSTTPGNRVYSQYRTKSKSVLWYNILQSLTDDNLTVALSDLSASYDIDSNVGEQLNVIGRVVVQDRVTEFPVAMTGIVESGDLDDEFGDLDAQFSELTFVDSVTLTDDEYRGMLKSKIQRNNTAATIDEIMTAVNTVLSSAQVVNLNDNGDMTFDIDIIGTLTAVEISLLESAGFVPRPQCVMFNGYNVISTITGSASPTLDDMTSASDGLVDTVFGDIDATLDDMTSVAEGVAIAPGTWLEEGNYSVSTIKSVAVNDVTGDVWVTDGGFNLYKLAGGVGSFALVQFDVNISAPVAVDSSSGEVWISHFSGFAGEVYKSSDGSTPFVVQGTYPGIWPVAMAVNSSNGDVFITDSVGNTVYKLTGGVGSYVSQSYTGFTPEGVAVNSSNGDVWVVDTFFDAVYKQTAGVGLWVAQGSYPGSKPRHVTVNSVNDDVHVADANSNIIYKLVGGIGSYIDTSFPGTVPWGVAADTVNNKTWATDAITGIPEKVWALY